MTDLLVIFLLLTGVVFWGSALYIILTIWLEK